MANRLSEMHCRVNQSVPPRVYFKVTIPRFRNFLFCFLLMSITMLPGRAADRENVEYGRVGDVSLRLDMHLPDGPGPFPAAILVHGGAWVTGDRRTTVAPLLKPLADAGYAWFSISYRLVNDVPAALGGDKAITSLLGMGTAVDDVRQAVAYVRAHASEYRLDANRIALIGESAGAQLASMAALKPAPQGAVAAVVAFYCPSDLVSLAQTLKQVPDSLRQSIKGTLWETMLNTTLRQFSPIAWVSKEAPPFLLIHGTADTLVPYEQSATFCDALNNSGGNCSLYAVKGAGHGIRWWESQQKTSYKAFMLDWLNNALTSRPGARV